MADESHDKECASPEILARRTAKQWRHEERELASTHALWNTVLGAHAVIVGATGLFIGNNKFPFAASLFWYVFSVAVLALLGLIFLALRLRRFDQLSGAYFRITSQEPLPPKFDKAKEDKKCRDAEKQYKLMRDVLEPTEVLLFIANLIMLYFVVSQHS
jgi:hypothetical protein